MKPYLPEERLMNRKEAADYMNYSHATLAAWALKKAHGLKVIKIGRSVRYRRSDIDRFLENQQLEK